MSLEEAESFTSDQVTSEIKSCGSSRAYGPDSLSIFHLKNLGPLDDSLKSCHLMSIWKSSRFPSPAMAHSKAPPTNPSRCYPQQPRSSRRSSYPLSSSINEFLSPAKDQHGFRPRHSTTSALLQFTTDIETGFNQRKPPHRTMFVAIDQTAAFDTVSHNILISITDITMSTPPVKRVCYADDITVWASGPKIPQLESMINSYLRGVGIYLKETSLLISAPKSTDTLFTPDK